MTNRRSLALLCLFGAFSCKTAEYRSVPGPDKSAPPAPPSVEIMAQTLPDPIPERVPPLDPITEISLNPTIEEVGIRTEDRIESFTQDNIRTSADILIVIDDSDSMRQEQKNLSSKMKALIKSLTDVDWQIGVITTTAVPRGNEFECRLTLIKSNDADAEEKYAKAVQAGTLGSGNEQGILQAVVGLKCPDQPWVREKSSLAVLIVSDEDNCSNGKGCSRSEALSERYLTDYVEKDLGRMIGLNAGFYGIYSPPGDECKNAPAPAHIYQRLIEYRVPGQKNFGKICEASYQSTLERISDRIADLLKNTFELKEAPLKGTVRVDGERSDGKAITDADYSVAGKILGFNIGSEPKRGSTIKVSYKVKGS